MRLNEAAEWAKRQEFVRQYMRSGPKPTPVVPSAESTATRDHRLREERRRAERSDEAMAQKRAEAEEWRRQRADEMAPWLEKLAQLERRAKDVGPEREAMGHGDLDAALDAHCRRWAAARMVEPFRDMLRRRFPSAPSPVGGERV